MAGGLGPIGEGVSPDDDAVRCIAAVLRGVRYGRERLDVGLLGRNRAFEDAHMPVPFRTDCWWAHSRAVRRRTVSSSSTWRR